MYNSSSESESVGGSHKSDHGHSVAHWGRVKSLVILLVSTVLMSLCAEILTSNIQIFLANSSVNIVSISDSLREISHTRMSEKIFKSHLVFYKVHKPSVRDWSESHDFNYFHWCLLSILVAVIKSFEKFELFLFAVLYRSDTDCPCAKHPRDHQRNSVRSTKQHFPQVRSMGAIWSGTGGTCPPPPTFSTRGNIPYFIPPTFCLIMKIICFRLIS